MRNWCYRPLCLHAWAMRNVRRKSRSKPLQEFCKHALGHSFEHQVVMIPGYVKTMRYWVREVSNMRLLLLKTLVHKVVTSM